MKVGVVQFIKGAFSTGGLPKALPLLSAVLQKYVNDVSW